MIGLGAQFRPGQIRQFHGQQLIEHRIYRTVQYQICAALLVALHQLPGRLGVDLIDKALNGPVDAAHKIRIHLLRVLVVEIRRKNLLNFRQGHALLQGADHEHISQMPPAVALAGRRRHDPQTNVIIDTAGGDEGIFLVLGDEAQIPAHQRHHLIHIQVHIRKLLPAGQAERLHKVLPPGQLLQIKLLHRIHAPFLLFSLLYHG